MIKSSDVWWFLIVFIGFLVFSTALAGCVTTGPVQPEPNKNPTFERGERFH